jgi:hypothetical protein
MSLGDAPGAYCPPDPTGDVVGEHAERTDRVREAYVAEFA